MGKPSGLVVICFIDMISAPQQCQSTEGNLFAEMQ